MKTTRTPYRSSTQAIEAGAAGQRFIDANFYARPVIETNAANFTLAAADDGRSRWRGNFSALNNDSFSPGQRPGKRFRGPDGSAVSRGAALTAADFQGFGRPNMTAIPTGGLLSNHTVPSNNVLMVSPERQDELPDLGELAIMRIDALNRPQQWTTAGDAMLDTTPRDTWNLAAFNYYLARQQTKPPDLAQYIQMLQNPPQTGDVNWHDPWSIMSHFYPYGIVSSAEKSADNEVSTPRFIGNKSYDGSGRKNAGLTISGRDQMYNIWGRHLEIGTNLNLVLRPVERPKTYVTNNYHKSSRTVRQLGSTNSRGQELVDYPFQLIPHASARDRPPDSILLYRDLAGVERRAPYIRFASVFKMDDGPMSFPDATDISRDVALSRGQLQIDVVVLA